jgi:hypothetical protein
VLGRAREGHARERLQGLGGHWTVLYGNVHSLALLRTGYCFSLISTLSPGCERTEAECGETPLEVSMWTACVK